MIGWIIALTIVSGLGVAGGIGWSKLQKEHKEARSLSLDGVDFGKLKDGIYQGNYEGGMYKWRRNACQVTVSSGKVSNIQMAKNADLGAENADPSSLYERVIQTQSLQVDVISGATLTSKAYLKAVENALIQAQ